MFYFCVVSFKFLYRGLQIEGTQFTNNCKHCWEMQRTGKRDVTVWAPMCLLGIWLVEYGKRRFNHFYFHVVSF